MRKSKMNAKKLMVSFVLVMALILVATSVSALTIDGITVDGIDPTTVTDQVSVTAGETITVKVYFTAEETDKDVTVKVELGDNEVETERFNIVEDKSYRKVLNIKVPYEFDDDELDNDDVELKITIEGDELDEVEDSTTLNVQRPSYEVEFKLPVSSSGIEAGETLPIDILVKNTGYNDLDDLYVTAKISALGVKETTYLGDLVDVEEASVDDDETDTMNKRMYLKVPYGAAAGTYVLEIEVSNEDAIISKTVEFEVTNSLPETVIKSGSDLIIVNPTDKVAVYRVVYNEKEVVESVNAGESKKVSISTPEGEYSFDVSVFSMTGEIVGTVNFSGASEESTVATFESPVVILTVVLAIIFLVLLVVLIVLVTKKPEKTEEFGESYY